MKMKEQELMHEDFQRQMNAKLLAMKSIPRMQSAPQKPEFNPNSHEAWSIPLSQLVNLWQAKYGDKWIDVSDLDDAFWPEASARLHLNYKMETYDRENTPWARLKEDA
jgi:hypothetical protein